MYDGTDINLKSMKIITEHLREQFAGFPVFDNVVASPLNITKIVEEIGNTEEIGNFEGIKFVSKKWVPENFLIFMYGNDCIGIYDIEEKRFVFTPISELIYGVQKIEVKE